MTVNCVARIRLFGIDQFFQNFVRFNKGNTSVMFVFCDRISLTKNHKLELKYFTAQCTTAYIHIYTCILYILIF